MTKEELFKKYDVDPGVNSAWDQQVDSWNAVEIYRVMNNGQLPKPDDKSTKFITEFVDKFHADEKFMKEVMTRQDWGSLYNTSKRLIYALHKEILTEINGEDFVDPSVKNLKVV